MRVIAMDEAMFVGGAGQAGANAVVGGTAGAAGGVAIGVEAGVVVASELVGCALIGGGVGILAVAVYYALQ